MYDIAILGGGPAGLTAAVYAARKMLDTLVVTVDIGGQMMLTNDIENWTGFTHISGFDLTARFEEHVAHYDTIDMHMGEKVAGIVRRDDTFVISTTDGDDYEARSLILATGKRSRPLGVPGEKELAGRGISYCATCDAPIYADRVVGVVGGGNSAAQAVIDLLPIATKVVTVNVMPSWQADPVLVERIAASGMVESYLEWEVVRILGDTGITGMRIRHIPTGGEKDIALGGLFVEIGLIPNSNYLDGVVDLSAQGEVVIDCLCRTSTPGIFAAGDVTTVPVKQIVVAAGEGSKAALSAYDYLVMNGYWTGRATPKQR